MDKTLRIPKLDGVERDLVEDIAGRRAELVALACKLIGYDTTSRAYPTEPAREDRVLQTALADRLQEAGADVELWEPPADDVAGHPLSPPEPFSFAGRPQMAARFRGSGRGRSVLFNGHIDVVPASRADGWEQDPFDPLLRDGEIIGRGACDMKGGIASMVIAAEALARTGELAGDLVVCTNTEEESSGLGALACARHGVRADFTFVPEPTGLHIWPACRGNVYATVEITGRAGHSDLSHPHWRNGGAVNAIEKARHFLAGVEHLNADWRSRPELQHAVLSSPALVPTRLTADSGWDVTIPDRAQITLAVSVLPAQTDDDGWMHSVRGEVEGSLRRWCSADDWLAAHPPIFIWYGEFNPSETAVETASVQALLGANDALDLPSSIGGLDSWYDGATFALAGASPALMYGPAHIDWAHQVNEHVKVDDLVQCAQGLAVAARRLCA